MRYMKSVESATQVKSTDYQLKAARKYQSSFNSLYTISGAGTNPVMIEMFNNDASLVWALASIVMSATSAGFKVVEHTNRCGRLVRLDIRPYMVEEPEGEYHVFEKVTSPQMTLIMLEVARIIKMNISIRDGAEIPNIKYFQDDGIKVPAEECNISSITEQVSSNELLKELLSRVDVDDLTQAIHIPKVRVEPVVEEVVIAPSPIRVDTYPNDSTTATPVEKWMDANLSPDEKNKMCNFLNKSGSSIRKLSLFNNKYGRYIAPSDYVFSAFRSRRNCMVPTMLHDFDITAGKLLRIIGDNKEDISTRFLDKPGITQDVLLAELDDLCKTNFEPRTDIPSKLNGTIVYNAYKDIYGIVVKVYADATGVASFVLLAFDLIEDQYILNFHSHARYTKCNNIRLVV